MNPIFIAPAFLRITPFILITIISVMFVSCEKEMAGQTYRVYDDKMMDELMKEKNLTLFLDIVDKANFRGTVHASGTYTFFVPTDDAVKLYLQSLGKNLVSELTEDEAISIVKYHLIANDTIATSDFVDGRLRTRNFMKKFITTKAQTNGSVVVDRNASIVTKSLTKLNELRGANGFIHIIDAVLTPPAYSVTALIRSLPDDNYKIIKEFFEKSGLADSLAVGREGLWYTFFVQDDAAFRDAGITNETELIQTLRANQKSTTKTDAELVRDFIGYHTLVGNAPKYVVDLLSASALQTYTPENKPILFERKGDQVWLDRLVVDKINEPGVKLDRASDYTDLSCSNGVVHRILGNIQVKDRTAYRVYWDIATQPEIMALAGFRKAGTSKTYNSGELSEMTWGGTYLATITYSAGTIPKTEAEVDATSQFIYKDYLRFNLHPNTLKWIEFKLPVLMPGEYKVWVCYRRELNLQVKTTFKQEGKEDQVMPYIFNMNEYMPSGTPEQQELLGWKQYSAKKYSSVVCSHLLGTIKVYFEGRHTLRLEPIYSKAQGQAGSWDMFQFIPKDEDQTFPRVDMLGNWVEKDTPEWQIYPFGTDPNPTGN
jgi:uncharacterized surface protein with fasciclin (FAS1) repeats